jgi:hypothetical protein
MANSNFKVRHGLDVGDSVRITDAGVVTGLTELTLDNININGNTISSTTGDILITPNGTGDVDLVADTVQVGDANATATITTNGTGDLVLNTNAGTNAGSITLANGANGNITLAPNGTGDVVTTFNNGGNLFNNRNYVLGAIRNATTESNGEIYTFGPAGTGFKGISLDNSADTADGPATLLRSFSGGAVANNFTRGRLVFEKARGTSASPTAVQSADQLASIDVTGYTSTGWIADLVAAPTATQFFAASENWVSTTNLGTQYSLNLAATGTTITSGASLTPVIQINPQSMALRGDAFSIGRGKTIAFSATGSSISGTTLTIGTVTSGTVAVGQLLLGANITAFGVYIVRNLTGSGSGSTWTVSQSTTAASGVIAGNTGFVGSDGTKLDALADLRLLTNVIENSAGTDVITMTSGNTTTTVNTTQLNLNNPTTATSYNNSSTIFFNTGNPAGAGFNDRVSQLRVSTATTSSTEASTITFNTGKFNTGTGNFSATQSGDYLGEFFFGGNYGTSTTFDTLGPSVRFRATAAENFTATNSGGAFAINLDKIGGSTTYDAISISSANASISSDIITLENNSGTDFVVIDANTAKFNVPVTTELTTTTISEGTTYTPAATVDNNISVQIDTLSGGTTVIDLASLTGNSRGASYNILVFNNTASGTPIQVKNTRINSNNLMTHTITTGSPRIIINAYVVGDYATATHLVVA